MDKLFTYDIDEEVGNCLDAEKAALTGRRPAYENIIVCLYELGAIARHTIYSGRKIEDLENAARCADICTELGDVICQALIMYKKFGKLTKQFANMSASDIIYEGLERQQFRMAELVAKGGVDLLQDRNLFTEA